VLQLLTIGSPAPLHIHYLCMTIIIIIII